LTDNPIEVLLAAGSHGDHEPSSVGEMRQQRLRDHGRGRGDQDAVEELPFAQPQRAVAHPHLDVFQLQEFQHFSGASRKLGDSLDGEDLPRQPREDGGLVAGARPHLQDPLVRPDLEHLRHAGNDFRLRDALAEPDGQRVRSVGLLHQGLLDEEMARDLLESVQDGGILHSALGDPLDHLLAPDSEVHLSVPG
jgi:hypothetical protein